MKLLFDQNISFRITKLISSKYQIAKQVRDLGLENSTDMEIWKFAKSNGPKLSGYESGIHQQKMPQKYYLTIKN